MKIKRKKINRTFGFKSSKRAVNYSKAAKKKHRNLTPFFTQNLQSREFAYTTWFFLQRCETHNFNKNPYLNALRLSKYQRETKRYRFLCERTEESAISNYQLLKALNIKSGNRWHYLGEWHTHPQTSPIPSHQDYIGWSFLPKNI